MVEVQSAVPGVFDPGILNQDGTLNSALNPAAAGTTLQIFATGLVAPNSSGHITAYLHDVFFPDPPYAGPAPGIEGLQQVNLIVPDYLPAMTTELNCR